MPGKPIRIAFLGDERDLTGALGKSEAAMRSAADEAKVAGRTIDSSFNTAAEGADNVASKGSQAAGALSGLGGLAATQGGQIGALGGAMATAGIATQALADSGDLLNVVTESNIVKTTLAKASQLGNAAATIASTAATRAATAGQWLLNAALSANPLGLIVIGLVAATAGIILLYKKSSVARGIINGVFGAVTHAAAPFLNLFTHVIPGAIGGVVGFVKSHWRLIVSIMLGPLGLIIAGVTGHVDDIRGKFGDLIGFVADIPGKLRGMVSRFTDAGGALIGGIVHGLSNPVGSVGPIAESVVNGIIDFLNSHLPHSLSINKGPIHLSIPLFPTIPRLASGGITTGPMLALIGDNPGGHEAVIPLNRAGKFGTRNYTINVSAPVGSDAYTIGETIVGFIEEFENGQAA